MHAVFISPLMHCFLGATVTDRITASDASQIGGAIGMGEALTSEGQDFTAVELFRCL